MALDGYHLRLPVRSFILNAGSETAQPSRDVFELFCEECYLHGYFYMRFTQINYSYYYQDRMKDFLLVQSSQ